MSNRYSNLAQTTLATASLSAGATSFTVASAANFPIEGNFQICVCAVDQYGNISNYEIMTVTGVSGNVFTVNRAQEGTTALKHNGGETVANVLTAATFAASSGIGGVTINGLGDSIVAQATYQPYGAGINATYSYAGTYYCPLVPQWLANTAYNAGTLVRNGNLIYANTAGGTSGTTAPTGLGSSNDGGITWFCQVPMAAKFSTSFLAWAEIFSNGLLYWDMSQGYSGVANSLIKVIVTNPGSGYKPGDTITFGGGATGTLNINSAGQIASVTITNGGYTNPITFVSINSATGSGGAVSLISTPSGTFGVSGCTTSDMIARLPDCVNSTIDIFVVAGGTNDIYYQSNNFANITGNLKICYETLLNAGKRIIAATIIPRDESLTNAQQVLAQRVNNWIREYVRKTQSANPNAVTIALADPAGFYTDATSPLNIPIGGTGNVQRSMTLDGTHPSPRGAMYHGYTVWQAAQQLLQGSSPLYPARNYCQGDGYDIISNPSGNMLEGLSWYSSTTYEPGQLVYNDTAPVKIYACTTGGVSASSGGPTGTSTSITDGTVTWSYVNPAGMSVMNSGTNGTLTAATGVTINGNLAGGYILNRLNGSASGSLTATIESPWSNGQNGQRQSLTFVLGNGTVGEQWAFRTSGKSYPLYGIVPSDINNTPLYAECEVEISSVANLNQLQLDFWQYTLTGAPQLTNAWLVSNNAFENAFGHMNTNGEMLPIPNGGKFLLRTQPLIYSTEMFSLGFEPRLLMGFDASGGTSSATAQIKINYMAIKKGFQL